MSLIMDALEKVQREAKTPVANWPEVDRPQPKVAASFTLRQEMTDASYAEKRPILLGYRSYIILFAVALMILAVLGFEKISASLLLPPLTGFAPAVFREETIPVPPAPGPGVLRGVLKDPAGSFCILGDQILKIGDTWRGYTVLSIEAQQVVVQDTQNRLLTLKLQES